MVVSSQNDQNVNTNTTTNYGTIKSGSITVTNGASVLVRFSCVQDVPTSNISNFGIWTITLYRDGVALTAGATSYDDNFCLYAILEAADTPGNGAHTYSVGLVVTPNGGVAQFNLKSMQLVLQQFKR